jgi:hypothetical protein
VAAKRIFKLKGSEPWLDRLAIMTELCLEMTPSERFAVLQYLITRHNQGEFTAGEASVKLGQRETHAYPGPGTQNATAVGNVGSLGGASGTTHDVADVRGAVSEDAVIRGG